MIVLASGSPRRKELMKEISPSFSIDAADIDDKDVSFSPEVMLNLVPYITQVAVGKLKELGTGLINIHGQHDGQQLLDEEFDGEEE